MMSIKNRETLILNSIKSTVQKSYGFIADPNLTPSHNAAHILQQMPMWHYLSRPTNLEMHNMTLPDTRLPKCLSTIIGLGLQFCPTPSFLNRRPTATYARFRKDFLTKVYFSGRPINSKEDFFPKMVQ